VEARRKKEGRRKEEGRKNKNPEQKYYNYRTYALTK